MMTLMLRIVLIVVSVATTILIMRRIRQSKLQIVHCPKQHCII